MKKTINFWLLAMLLAVCVGFSSCSNDDEGGGNGEYYEFTINGKTDKSKLVAYDVFTNGTMTAWASANVVETADCEFQFSLNYHASKANFDQSGKPGSYKVSLGDGFDWRTSLPVGNHFEFFIGLNEEYALVSAGTHNVTEVKFDKEDKDKGKYYYFVAGTISCQAKSQDNGTTLNITGKYRIRIEVK